MNYFVIGYYALLISGSCLAAHYKLRGAFLILFSLTLASFVMGIVGGEDALWTVTIAAGLLALAAGTAYSFREFLIIIARPHTARALRTAPLTAAFGMFVIFTYAVLGIFAPVIAPYGEAEVISQALRRPTNRCCSVRTNSAATCSAGLFTARGIRSDLALVATSIAFFLGALLGMIAAVKQGWFDQIMGRVIDVVMSIPSLIFALLLLSIFGTNLIILVIIIGVIYAPRVYRLTRAVAGNVVVMDYIEAAKLRGEGMWYLIRKEILPNSTAPLIAEFGLEFCFVFLLVAGLSFLGLGIQPPTADWGSMVRENATLISFGELTPLIPAGAIALLTVAVNMVVDWMLFRSTGLKE